MKTKMKLFIALVCVLLACLFWSPAVLAVPAVTEVAADPAVASEIGPLLASNKTPEEIANDPVVKAAIEAAWADSNAGNATHRHEEGGWIYEDASGNLTVDPWPSGNRSSITPGPPAPPEGSKVVGEFHTHPNPPVDEDGTKWEQGPSEGDKNAKDPEHVGIVRNAAGTVLY